MVALQETKRLSSLVEAFLISLPPQLSPKPTPCNPSLLTPPEPRQATAGPTVHGCAVQDIVQWTSALRCCEDSALLRSSAEQLDERIRALDVQCPAPLVVGGGTDFQCLEGELRLLVSSLSASYSVAGATKSQVQTIDASAGGISSAPGPQSSPRISSGANAAGGGAPPAREPAASQVQVSARSGAPSARSGAPSAVSTREGADDFSIFSNAVAPRLVQELVPLLHQHVQTAVSAEAARHVSDVQSPLIDSIVVRVTAGLAEVLAEVAKAQAHASERGEYQSQSRSRSRNMYDRASCTPPRSCS